MGGVAVGLADDGAAWSENPAGLGALNLKCAEGKMMANDVIVAAGKVDDESMWGISWSGWDPAKKMGFGAGYGKVTDEGKAFGAGFGMAIGDTPFSVGINGIHTDPDFSPQHTPFAFGAMYQFPQIDKAPIRVGLLARDITDVTNEGRQYDLGVTWPATPDLLVAADLRSFSDSDERALNVGAEYALGTYKEWRARAGMVDNGDGHDLTLGAGYAWKTWRVDLGWQDAEDTTWELGVGYGF